MTMLPGQPRRPSLAPNTPQSTSHGEYPEQSVIVTQETTQPVVPPPVVHRGETVISQEDLIRFPVPATRREPLKLSANMAALVTAIGGLLILLSELDGLGFIPAGARTMVALVIAALLPIVMYFIPGWKARKP